MATSGITGFNITRDQLIRSSLRLMHVVAPGETPTASQVDDAEQALNMMILSWQASGLGLWTRQKATLFLQPGQDVYKLGPDNETPVFVDTTLTSETPEGGNSLSVVSNAGMAVGDHVGILISTSNWFWTTVTGVAQDGLSITVFDGVSGTTTPSVPNITAPIGGSVTTFKPGSRSDSSHCASNVIQTTLAYSADIESQTIIQPVQRSFDKAEPGWTVGVVLNDGAIHWAYGVLIDSSAGVVQLSSAVPSVLNSGNKVYMYEKKIGRPLALLEGRYRVSGLDEQTSLINMRSFMNIRDKSQVGSPSKLYFDAQLELPELNVWPVPGVASNAAENTIEMTLTRPVEHFTSIDDTPDLPPEWLRAVKWGLAYELANEYALPMDKITSIASMAQSTLALAAGWDMSERSLDHTPLNVRTQTQQQQQ